MDSNKPAETEVVKKTWTQIKSSLGGNASATVGRLIFENLFNDYPKIVNFFNNYGNNAEEIMSNKTFMIHANEKVFVTFDKIITNLENQKAVTNIASWVATVHKPKGVTQADLLNLGSAILKTLKQALGPDFTPEVELSWTTVVTEFMNLVSSQIEI